MLKKFMRIKEEFGNVILYKTLLLGIGMLVMSIAAVYFYNRVDILILAAAITIISCLIRRQIVAFAELLPAIFNAGLVSYGIALSLGGILDISNGWTLFIITITTAIMFNMQFWILSDTTIVNLENDWK